MTKICRKCKQKKPLEEFTKHRKMKDGYDTICLVCNRAHASKWNEQNRERYLLKCKRAYRRNRAEELRKAHERYEEVANYLKTLKDGKCCTKCRWNEEPHVLHFHHRNPAEKSFGLSASLNLRVAIVLNEELIHKEIAKCDLLCPNCHSVLHYRLRHKKEPLI